MTIGTGTGNTISFSTIRDFYGDTNPVAISDFNRNTSNNTLVDATFVGASTATTNNVSATKNDFGITVANDSTSSTINHGFGTSGTTIPIDTGTAGGSTTTLAVFCQSGDTGGYSVFQNGVNIGGVGEGQTSNITVNNGQNVTISQSFGNPQGGSASYTRLTRVYDVTFANNNSTGDTYTLASSSTGHSTKSVYAAGESQQVKNNSASNSWTIAYDNVTGSGSGTAGDIGVTVASGSGIPATLVHNGGSGTSIVTAPSGVHSYVSVSNTATNQDPDGNQNVTSRVFRNGVQVASAFSTEGGIAATYTGTIVAGDVFTGTGASSGGVNVITLSYKNPDKVITYQNNGSSSFTLGSSSTGGARTIAASASATVQPGGSTNNESWAVHFDTSSGDCNVGIPTTIGAGNPVNLNLFNTVTTPVG